MWSWKMHESNRGPSVSTDSLCVCWHFEIIFFILCKSTDACVRLAGESLLTEFSKMANLKIQLTQLVSKEDLLLIR